MKILIADKLSPQAVQALEESGLEVAVKPELSAADLPAAIAGFQVLVVRSTEVDRQTIEAADQLSLIVRAGAGVNTIDVAAASARGIFVANCPGQNSAAVAELAIGLLIACDRRIADATLELRAGKWNKKKFSEAAGLKGRTLGILGLGAIGEEVARRAQGLEMNVLAWSRSLTRDRAEELGLEFAASPLEVARQSDAISIHLAANSQTRQFVNAAFLEAMQPGAMLINTSRGDVIDTAALKNAIRSKGLRVGLDVFENEPGSGTAEFADTDLAGLVTCTPHIGASTGQASEAIAAKVVEIVKSFRETGRPPHIVNLCEKTAATHALVVRHYNQVGVLAGILDALREEGINVEEMENAIFSGDTAACCTMQLSQAPKKSLLDQLAQQAHVLQVHLEPL